MKRLFMIKILPLIFGLSYCVDLSSGWPTNLGCFLDDQERVLPNHMGNNINNLTVCIGLCRNNGTRYAGIVIGHQCFCGNDWPRLGYAPQDTNPCDKTCVGSEACGGMNWAINVYTVCPNGTYWSPSTYTCTSCHSCEDPICHQANGDCTDEKCKSGWEGKKCDQECVNGRYGSSCQEYCGQCLNDSPCDKTTGECPNAECKQGFQEPMCKECIDDKYGSTCRDECGKCLNNAPCNKETGQCPHGDCQSGYIKPLCQECFAGRYGSTCVDRCGKCLNGDLSCDKETGTCPNEACQPNYKGPLCHECSDGRYGSTCVYACGKCLNGEPCDKETGQCPNGACKEGYKGPMCQECTEGRYGLTCTDECGHCLEDRCDKTIGHCPNDECQDGYQQPMCQKCANGRYGSDCIATCGNCSNDAPCDKETGQCPNGECKQGYRGPMCKECTDYKHGSNCEKDCGNCLSNEPCDKVNGECSQCLHDGWKTPMCKECIDGRSGPSCNGSCGFCLNGEPCDQSTGECPDGKCKDGYQKPICKECVDGRYGSSCRDVCGNCLDGASCNKTTGQCPNGECQQGYMGPMCKVCEDGRYGSSCTEKCGNCMNDAQCDKETGQCPNGECQQGYTGPMCTECVDGYYGGCTKPCGNCVEEICNKVNGNCSDKGCKAGWEGDMCLQGCSPGMYGSNCKLQCTCESYEECDPENGVCTETTDTRTTAATLNVKESKKQKGSPMPMIGGVVGALVVIAIIIIVIVLVLRFRRRTPNAGQKDLENFSPSNDNVYTNRAVESAIVSQPSLKSNSELKNSEEQPRTSKPQENMELKKKPALPQKPKIIPVLPSSSKKDDIYENRDLAKALKVEDIENYVKVMKEKKDGFYSEFKTIPSGIIAPCTIGASKEMKTKNRFKEIHPYDHSRVHLTTIPGVEGSDYINACHINGYKAPRKFIATQGPKDNTVEDFWRMVWEQKVSRIVMVANIFENTRKKCEKYWPDYLQSETFGTFVITNKKEEPFKGFLVRTMKIALEEKRQKEDGPVYGNVGEKERTVMQFHFTDWPDKGVPLYCTALVSFHRKITSMSEKVKTPIVVHCSAGIGRTGTYIALDYLTDQCQEEGVIDVFQCVNGLRKDRINMVQTEEQYVFLYETLYESLTTGVTLIPCFKFTEIHQQLQQIEPGKNITGLEAQYKILMSHKEKVLKERCIDKALKPENDNKNRSKEILPGNNVRVFVMSEDHSSHSYVNAVFAENYSKRNGVILTQLPLEETVEDFWRMVEKYYVNTIISLSNHQDETFQTSKFWPADTEEEMVVGPFTIQRRDISPRGTVNCCSLVLIYKGDERNIFLVGTTNWSDDEWKPSDVNTMYELYNSVQTWQKGHSSGGQTLIQCFDGGMKSGMYAVVSWMFDMINSEQEVDIFQITKQIILSRPEFMRKLDQYKELYNIAEDYMANFQNYANFK